ncbi:MAG: MaoC family dehydratase N-terminal domain-containing protein, partial [Acetobacteraceae bacterium]|nr:MaoC family dehydratase N-terminal domain-containing protein [Acetobacteraceae bacterium]
MSLEGDTRIDVLRGWVGREEIVEDVASLAPVAALAATLDRDDPPPRPGDPLPPLWHWLYFLPTAPHRELGPDGHPSRGGFLPPVALPRRMWAGGRVTWTDALPLGGPIRRRSVVADVSEKQGRAGPLVFVVVRHEIIGGEGPTIVEEHDIVYRAAPTP